MICQTRTAIEARVAWQRSHDLLTGRLDSATVARQMSEDVSLNRIRNDRLVQMMRDACIVHQARKMM